MFSSFFRVFLGYFLVEIISLHGIGKLYRLILVVQNKTSYSVFVCYAIRDIMSFARGLICSRCSSKINRYDDTIACQSCEKSFHLKCLNINIDDFNELRENGNLTKWICESCICPDNPSVTSSSQDSLCTKEDSLLNSIHKIVEKLVTPLRLEISELKNIIKH